MPEAPRLLTPSPDALVDASAVRFTWCEVPDAEGYTLRLKGPHDALDLDAGAATELELQDVLPSTGGAWSWRVRAETAEGPGPWSPERPFTPTTEAAATTARPAEDRPPAQRARRTASPDGPPAPEWPDPAAFLPARGPVDWNAVPGFGPAAPSGPAPEGTPPRPLGPLSGDLVDAGAVTFRWRGLREAVGYTVEVSPSNTFEGPVLRLDAGSATELALDGALPAASEPLFWRVRARTASGSGPWSAFGRFHPAHDAEADAYGLHLDRARQAARRVAQHQAEQAREALERLAPVDRADLVLSDLEARLTLALFGVSLVVTSLLILIVTA